MLGPFHFTFHVSMHFLFEFKEWKCIDQPEGLGELSAHVQLWGGGGAGRVVVSQRRALFEMSRKSPAAVKGHLGRCWTTAHNNNNNRKISFTLL